MSQWQDISTAPKDGARVLIFFAGAVGLPSEAIQIAQWSVEPYGPCWLTSEGEGWLSPTHWMPLPPAPEAKP